MRVVGSPCVAFGKRNSMDNASIKCRQCGYSLTGLSVPRCPECGTRFDDASIQSEREQIRYLRKVTINSILTAAVIAALLVWPVGYLSCSMRSQYGPDGGRGTSIWWRIDVHDPEYFFWVAWFPVLCYMTGFSLFTGSLFLVCRARIRTRMFVIGHFAVFVTSTLILLAITYSIAEYD